MNLDTCICVCVSVWELGVTVQVWSKPIKGQRDLVEALSSCEKCSSACPALEPDAGSQEDSHGSSLRKTSHKTCRNEWGLREEGPLAGSAMLLVFKVAWCDLICVRCVSVWSRQWLILLFLWQLDWNAGMIISVSRSGRKAAKWADSQQRQEFGRLPLGAGCLYVARKSQHPWPN